MSQTPDPFAAHPELRSRIAESETSYFRNFTVDAMLERREMAPLREWVHTDAKREAIRAETLADHEGDLWVFAYGSLMWDPALRFTDVRRVRLQGFARRFILVDDKGGRGTPEAPGLFAALDVGDHCDGLAFRIAAQDVEHETEILFRREVLAPAYTPRLLPLHVADSSTRALCFLADHNTPDIQGDISQEAQIRYLATGAGFLGTSYDYLANIVQHFADLGITDPHCTELLSEVDAYRAKHALEECRP